MNSVDSGYEGAFDVAGMAAGVGILTVALFPLAIPFVALTLVGLLPFALPLIAIAVIAAILTVVWLAIRGIGRGIRRLGRGRGRPGVTRAQPDPRAATRSAAPWAMPRPADSGHD
jgi:hypothetical protein